MHLGRVGSVPMNVEVRLSSAKKIIVPIDGFQTGSIKIQGPENGFFQRLGMAGAGNANVPIVNGKRSALSPVRRRKKQTEPSRVGGAL